MPQSPSIKSKTVRKYLIKFPKASKRAIARKIQKDHPKMFATWENIRSEVKRCTTKNKRRNRIKNPIIRETDFSYDNPYGFPESDEAVYEPYVLPKVNNNIGLLYDIHNPYHNIPALTCAIKYLQEQKINTLILAGDAMDCYKASRFSQDPSKRNLRGEIESMREMLQSFQKAFPLAKIFYLCGNHELRWELLLRNKAPEICDMDEFRLDIILGLRDIGAEWIGDKRVIKAGKLNIIHGHEFMGGGSGGVNPARSLYLKAKRSTIEGHFHQVSEHTEPDPVDGDLTTCWSVGCLCELRPAYMPLNKWSHGFAHAKVFDDGNFQVRNMRIKNGRIL